MRMAITRHMLALEQLEELLNENRDLKDSMANEAGGVDYRIGRLTTDVLQMQTGQDLSKCWYAGIGIHSLSLTTMPKSGKQLSSFSSRYRKALPRATPTEKIFFGITYGGGYGTASRAIHYSASNWTWRLEKGEERIEAKRLGILAMQVLIRCFHLLGGPDVPELVQLARSDRDNVHSSEVVDAVTHRNINKGDFLCFYTDIFWAKYWK